MKQIISFSVILIQVVQVLAQNPICTPGSYFADPSAKVFADGKLYLFGSVDESCEYYCSWHYDVFSTSDMKNWEISHHVFASKGKNDNVDYNDELLFAPDAAQKYDSVFLYYCQPDMEYSEGVAVANSANGPYGAGRNMEVYGHNQIDPSVFIDKDGSAYYLWGQFNLKMAMLKENMLELDNSTIKDNILTEEEHFFHEGAYLTKRNNLYYLVYADISREDKPTCIGYATAQTPFGPYTYGGVIIDNDGCNPGNWNNHGSIAEFNGQWYVFYHRSTHGCKTMRKACAEKINILPDGSIPEVEMTSQGTGPPLLAIDTMDAAKACLLHGNVRIEAISERNDALVSIQDGDAAIFKYIDFAEGVKQVSVRIYVHQEGKFLISAGKPWHKRLALLKFEKELVKPGWQILSFDVNQVSGVHALWLNAYGDEGDLFDVDWIVFE
jgi:hypothetical protein